MSEQSEKFTIKITTEADTSGAKKTADDLDKVAASAKGASAELNKVGQGISGDDLGQHNVGFQTDQLKDLGQAAEEGGEKFKIFGRGAHEFHAAIEGIGRAAPGVGEILRFMFTPVTAAIGIAALAFSSIQEAIGSFMDALKELDVQAKQGEWGDTIREQAEESATAFAVWEAAIQRVVRAEQTLQQLTDRSLAQSRDRLSTENEIGSAETELAKAKLELAEKLGQVTPEQAIKIRLEIDEAAFKRQAEAKVKEIEAEINARGIEADKNAYRQDQLQRGVDTARSASDAADATKAQNDGKLKQDTERLKAIQEEMKANQDWLDNYNTTLNPFYRGLHADEAARREQGQASLSRQEAGLRGTLSQEREAKPGLDADAQTAKKAYEDAQAKYNDAAKLENELNVKLAQLAEDLAAEKAKAAALENLHNATAEANAKGSILDDEKKKDAARREAERESGQYADTPQGESDYWINLGQDAMKAAEANLPGSQDLLHETIAQMTGLIRRHTAITESQTASLLDIQSQMSELDARLSNLQGQVRATSSRY
jgi:hypothetical protein